MYSNPKAIPDVDENGRKIMTPKYLRDLCVELELYETPELNTTLYVHFKGFSKIENLDAYVNLRCLFLDNNCITKIENLDALTQLKTLCLQHNQIEKIENLDNLKELVSLNLSNNRIKVIENLGELKNLQTLNLANNFLEDEKSLVGLLDCQSLTNIDLSSNKIPYSEDIASIFFAMKNLACLYLRNNPIIPNFPNYRKMMTASIPTLMYLDDRPITPLDRLLAEAFAKGGREAEKEAREKYNEEKRQKEIEWHEKNQEREEILRKRRQLELERYANDDLKEKEKILDKKKELLEKKPSGYEDSLKKFDDQLERIEQELAQKQQFIDRKLMESMGADKYSMVMRTLNDKGEYEYVNVDKEEYEKHMKEQKKKAKKTNQADNSVKGFEWTEDFDQLLQKAMNADESNFEEVSAEITKALYQQQKIKANEVVSTDQVKERWAKLQEKPKEEHKTAATNNLDELE